MCHEAIKIFKGAKMELHEFLSNNLKVNMAFGEEKELQRVLGIGWDLKRDVLILEIKKAKEDGYWTKRKVLKTLAKTFDPLGFLVPVNLPRKLFFQQLWKNGANNHRRFEGAARAANGRNQRH
jgi:hypothetical protein